MKAIRIKRIPNSNDFGARHIVQFETDITYLIDSLGGFVTTDELKTHIGDMVLQEIDDQDLYGRKMLPIGEWEEIK